MSDANFGCESKLDSNMEIAALQILIMEKLGNKAGTELVTESQDLAFQMQIHKDDLTQFLKNRFIGGRNG